MRKTTNCWSTPEFYFGVTDDGGADTLKPRRADDGERYAAEVFNDSVPLLEANMDVDPGWTTTGDWAWGQPTGGGGAYGGPDPTGGRTGANVYGYNLGGDYTSNMPERHLTTPPIDCAGHDRVLLSFWRWLGVEHPAFDHASVRVSTDGSTWATIWQNTLETTDDQWTAQTFDVSSIASGHPAVFVRWTMGPTDGGWQYCGWNLDDVRVFAPTCSGRLGDHNGDDRIDRADLDPYAACLTGPDRPRAGACRVFDLDDDGDVDLADFAAIERDWDDSSPMP